MPVLLLKMARASTIVCALAAVGSVVFGIASAHPRNPWRGQASGMFVRVVYAAIFVGSIYSLLRVCLWPWIDPQEDSEEVPVDLRPLRLDLSLATMMGLVLGCSVVLGAVSPVAQVGWSRDYYEKLSTRARAVRREELRTMLQSGVAEERRIARNALIERGVTREELLHCVAILQDSRLELDARWEAARLMVEMGELNDAGIRSAIANGLDSPDPWVRRHAAFVLTQLSPDAPRKGSFVWNASEAFTLPDSHADDVAQVRSWWAKKSGAKP